MGKVIVLGGGESGVGAAILAQKVGKEVFLSDGGQVKSQYKEVLNRYNIPFEEGRHTKESFFDAEIVIKSPGIPPWIPLVKTLTEKGIPVISEVEFAFYYKEAPIIAVTGSNGKTTTASLIHHLLKVNGVNASLGGNIGDSFALQVALYPKPEVYVLEISSFQLEDCYEFHPDIALLLNITPDHLDRYEGKMEQYADAKFRIAQKQDKDDVFIYQRGNEWINRGLEKTRPKAELQGFSLDKGGNAWVEEDNLQLISGEQFSTERMKILGPHNQMNALAALLAVKAFLGRLPRETQQGLDSFAPIPHRLEPVGQLSGVRFINDSKATNVDAVKFALEAIKAPIIWMAGGIDKGNDYEEIKSLVEEKVKAIVVLGEHSQKFHFEFSKKVYQAKNMREAVVKAKEIAHAGDQVLLSPACASFDLFQNYEDRGDQFRQAVNEE